jgi:CBS domain-containing protein
MARTVREIMNRELFTLRPDEGVDDALAYLVALGISGAPVLEGGRPIGVVSHRDLLARRAGRTVRERMTSPALTIPADARIEAAAREVAERGVHRIVVVDDDGRAVGVASSLDLLRGLVGVPASHPSSFPHLDLATGLSWTDDAPLDRAHVAAVESAPGLLVLVHGGVGLPERVVWAEAVDDLRARAERLTSSQTDGAELPVAVPEDEPPGLRALLAEPRALRFRVAVATNARERRRALHRILEDVSS